MKIAKIQCSKIEINFNKFIKFIKIFEYSINFLETFSVVFTTKRHSKFHILISRMLRNRRFSIYANDMAIRSNSPSEF